MVTHRRPSDPETQESGGVQKLAGDQQGFTTPVAPCEKKTGTKMEATRNNATVYSTRRQQRNCQGTTPRSQSGSNKILVCRNVIMTELR